MDTSLKGLSTQQAKELLEKHGPNVLPEKPPPSNLSLIIAQIKNPLVYVLVAAGTVTAFLGEIPDTIIIAFSILTNGVLGFIQEKKASKSLAALKSLIHPQAKVIRNDTQQELKVEYLVPTDIVILEQGSKIPADGHILQESHFFVSEAILTGESAPVQKRPKDQVFMGTIVSSGRAIMQVDLTGEETQIGKIALDVQQEEEDTPLKKQLKIFSKQLTYLVLFLTLLVFSVGFLRHLPLEEIFITSVALAVSSIPEGILVGTTIILAIGMQRIMKRKGLVRHLLSAETLGGVTTVCVDKTGTLTEGKMRVVGAFGDDELLAAQAIVANDLEDPMTISAHDWAKSKVNSKHLTKTHKRLDSIPFDSNARYFAALTKNSQTKNMIYVNGAPELVLSLSKLSSTERQKVKDHIDLLTSQGRRLVGFARKPVSAKTKKLNKSQIKKAGFEWIGLLSFSDPIRPGVKDTLQKVKAAGLKFIVITGDYPQTAIAVIKELGIDLKSQSVITGSQLKKLSPKALSKKLKSGQTTLFARTTPRQKLKIVDALKLQGEVVAMMGDGVNDAPALRKADIGIVVGEASDVAKETAELILLDSNFATIVAAIEEGRGIFDNIRKVLLYLLSDSFEEIIVVIGTIIFGLPLPVTAAQILWINIVSDGLPDVALTIDPKAPGIMNRPPRSPKENIVSGWMREIIAIVSISGGIMAFIVYSHFLLVTNNLEVARSVAFATLGVNSLIYVYSIRTLKEPFWRENPFDNPWLNLSVIGGFLIQFFPFFTPSTRAFFSLTPLDFVDLLFIFGASILMFIIIEVSKAIFKST